MLRKFAILLLLLPAAGSARPFGHNFSQGASAQKQDSAESDQRFIDAQQAIGKNDYAAAIPLLVAFLKDHPGNASAHFQLAYSYGSQKRDDDAIFEYRRAIEINPDLAPAELNLGLKLMEKGDAAGAAPFLQRAADLMPDQAKPRFMAALAAERSGNLDAALRQYEQAASLDPKDYDTLLRWGLTLLRARRPADAEQKLRAALTTRSDSDQAHLALASALLDEQKPDAAIVELTEFLKHNPNQLEARTQLATALYDSGKPAEALTELDRADAIAPPTLDRVKLRASILVSQQNWDAAVQSLTAAVNASPRDAALHAELGGILMKKHDYPPAEHELRRALAIDSSMTPTLRDLASTVYLEENYSGTLDLLDVLAQREPPLPIVLFMRATCYDKLQRKPEAVAAYQKFLDAEQSLTDKRAVSDKEVFQATERMKLLQKELSNKK
jgi:Tfp pilus assembly protein PilF